MTLQNAKAGGCVFLVGAGPGDAGLITVRGMELLRLADVVVFDALANPVLLDAAPDAARRIDVGKRAGTQKLSQDEINQLLVDEARAGHRVVRLKGGDPYLFGRGAEEVTFCAEHDVPCEVVPGITAGIAAPAAAGIPVTHRSTASMVTFVTGHEDPAKADTTVDYAGLASMVNHGGTVCFYMGVGRLGAITEALHSRGVGGDMPAALVQWGTLPRQRSVRTTLAHAVADVQRAGITSPAIIVVGRAAGIDDAGLDYFTRRPLFGQRVLVTRTRQQASALAHELCERGAEVIEAPTIEVVKHDDDPVIHDAVKNIADHDWLVLTSVNGVEVLARAMASLGLDARHLAAVKIAAIGSAVEEALCERLSIRADLVPTRYVAESLAGELIAQHDMAGKRVLLLRADIARPALPQLLAAAGAVVTERIAYETKIAERLDEHVLAALRERRVDWVTFTSSSTARNFVTLLGEEKHLAAGLKIASIGSITSQTIRELGLPVTVEAAAATIVGLADALRGVSGKR